MEELNIQALYLTVVIHVSYGLMGIDFFLTSSLFEGHQLELRGVVRGK